MGVLVDLQRYMNVIDIIILLPIAYGVVRGLMKGFVQELTGLVAIVAAVFCTKLWAPNVAMWLSKYLTSSFAACQLIAWFVIFVGVALSLHLAGKIISRLLSAISLGWLNRLVGAIFGAAKWVLVVSILLNGVALLDNRFHFLKPQVQEKSIAYEPIRKVAAIAWENVQRGIG